MATMTKPPPFDSVADLLSRLGDIPPERIRMTPFPGTAKVKDVIAALDAPRRRICELIDGVLVEKAMGSTESLLAGELRELMGVYLKSFEERPGFLLGEAGTLEMLPHMVRIPDLCFVSRERVGGDEWPDEAAPEIVPDLAVEVISKSNTRGEMTRKLDDYFKAGVREVWYIYPKTQTIDVYTAPDQMRRIPKDGILKGSIVLPEYSLPLAKFFGSTNLGHKKR
jgi:Uma2 family endonuclease